MNIDNISKGQIFKNYKHLCQELGEQVKDGNAKKAQLKMWEGCFSYFKEGNKFIITEIFDNPNIHIIKRGGANHILPHAHKMELSLLNVLNANNGELSYTMNRLLKDMNMVNLNFKFGSRNRKKVSQYLDIKESFLEEFFVATKRTLSSNIESMLNRLQDQKVITWCTIKMVCVATSETEKNLLGDIKVHSEIIKDEFDNEEIKLSTKTNETLQFRPATEEESDLIEVIEDKVIYDLDCKNKQEVVIKDRWSIFRNRVNNILKEEANIQFYYDSYEIIKSKNNLSKVKTLHNTNDTLTLNQNVQIQLLTNWERRQQKVIEKGKGKIIRIDDNYMEYASIFIDTFINLDHENVIGELKKLKSNTYI